MTQLQCSQCAYRCDTKTQLQLHAAVMHNRASEDSMKLDCRWCPICLLLFDGRAQALEHIGKSQECRVDMCSFDDLSAESSRILQTTDNAARASNIKAGFHKAKVEMPATRMMGPWKPILDIDGAVINRPNGHPLGPSFPRVVHRTSAGKRCRSMS